MDDDDSDSDMTNFSDDDFIDDQMETSENESVVNPSPVDDQSNDSSYNASLGGSMSFSSAASSMSSASSVNSVEMYHSPTSSDGSDSPVVVEPGSRDLRPISSSSSGWSDGEAGSNYQVPAADPAPTPVANVMEAAAQAIAQQTVQRVVVTEQIPGPSSASTSSSPKSRKRPADDDSDSNDVGNDDGSYCSICLEVYTNSGDHRIVSIKCGHLFGKSCIERWLKVSCGAIKRCPSCNTKAAVKDIRIIYAKKLTAMDTAENDRLKNELEKAYSDNKRLELELTKCKMNVEMLEKRFLEQQKEMKSKFPGSSSSGNPGCIHCNRSQSTVPRLVHTHRLSKGGGRVLAHNKYLSLLVASHASANPVFQGFGITKINSLDFNISEFVYLHPKPIRDLSFHQSEPNVLLSVSLDKTAKLVDVSCNSVVHTYQAESPVWSCCWDLQNPNVCFIGTQSGSILQFDRRRTDKVMLELAGDRTPIVGLSSVPAVPGRTLSRGGIIACRLSSIWALERGVNEGFINHRLPLEGTFISLNFDKELDLILASARPNQQCSTARHMVYQLTPSDNPARCQHLHTFHGGSTVGNISRSRLFNANKETFVCAFNESSKAVEAFQLSSFSKKFSLPSKENESVSDLLPFYVNQSLYLSTVSDNYLSVYSIPAK
ncbi:E3 ubiquitin-protein ligase RFWD3 isoform X2 [Bemisia tabaci]|uniref:E3 ubiquitin-protein ligase RFWD3 isoform X2 n=1 Tax=Bemisia tabaci TaxID=7038 RepID=UPI003B27C7B9